MTNAAVTGFSVPKMHLHNTRALHPMKTDQTNSFPTVPNYLKRLRTSTVWNSRSHPLQVNKESSSSWRVNALPPLMAVMIEHVTGQRDYIVHKSVWHLTDEAMKNVYTMYIMFTCWGCCFFGSTKDPFYDGEEYRKDGGDGTVHWYYEKQEDIEAAARAELWREELIQEIEQKVGGLRELEEAASKEEELVKYNVRPHTSSYDQYYTTSYKVAAGKKKFGFTSKSQKGLPD
ncbi:photosynthetic NDH subunit of subcomplex B 4, chloroplastic isoform X1 [Asparagus officinalis]|uniref:photosynthetic NDH subunit of subcomplex B 4, chloroplastic isoform X1 n=1 Tax=Asparagus officinalis TaxID=4686 RepID=UPI00098E41D1|nr:photosynthetic NDH subunit of subcomplex B 4, chloroplastic isoform X1 [Asparagus officinalis]